MDQSRVWGPPRYVALLAVLALHLALLAVLLSMPGTRHVSLTANEPIEVLFIPPPAIPRIRAENSRPRRLRGDTALPISPPALAADALPPAGAGSAGDGSGVDWAAEARRALQAFEIRKHQPPANTTVSRSPAEENWWPQARHRAGDQYKTASGDWIVWINASCYQVANSAPNSNAPGELLRPTICPGESNAPRHAPGTTD